MRLLIAFILFGWACTGYSQEDKVDAPQIAVKLTPGQSVDMDGTEVTFVEVLEDSRCPTSVDCIWNGRARILVKVMEDGEDPTDEIVIFGELKEGEEHNTLLALSDEYSLEVLQLNPYPTVPREELDYFLLVKKVEKGD